MKIKLKPLRDAAETERVRLECIAQLRKENERAIQLRRQLIQAEARIRYYERIVQVTSKQENN